jgi:hypothetical protein
VHFPASATFPLYHPLGVLQPNAGPTEPDTMPITKWQCCSCHNRPILAAVNGFRCICGHDHCGNCKNDDKIDPPGVLRTAIRPRRLNSKPFDAPPAYAVSGMGGWPSSTTPGEDIPARASAHIQKRTTLASRPSMAGWWYCHRCGAMNNPDLTDGKCSSCNHTRCAHCKNMRH